MRRHAELWLIGVVSIIALAVVVSVSQQWPVASAGHAGSTDATSVTLATPVFGSPPATVEPGQLIPALMLDQITDLTLVATVQGPVTSLDDVLAGMRDDGISAPWLSGVTLAEADYGLATWGKWVLGEDGNTSWLGQAGLTLRDGEQLERYENRPAWVITFDMHNLQDPPGQHFQTYLVDASSGEVMLIATLEDSADDSHDSAPAEGTRP